MSDGPLNPEEPVLMVRDCDCGQDHCGLILFAIRHPQIKRVEGTGELIPAAYFPIADLPSLIDCLEGYLRRARPRACRPRQEEQGERPS